MIFFTSIPPIGNYSSTVNSWLEIGKVYSINCTKEIVLLKDQYPDVIFVRDDRSLLNEKEFGKPYVNITSFFELGIKLQEEVICIINADIYIRYDKKLFDICEENIKQGHFIIGSKYSYSSSFDDGNLEKGGIDIFMFNKNILPNMPKESKFMIGQTYWDFWFPVLIIKQKIKIYKIEQPVFFHKKHPLNWSHESWMKMGHIFLKELNIDINNEEQLTSNYIAQTYRDLIDNYAIELNQ